MLHSVQKHETAGRTQWCGPTALAAITGEGYANALTRLKQIMRAPRAPTGVPVWAMLHALREEGRDVEAVKVNGKPTLARWLRERPAWDGRATFLLVVTRHYVVVQGRKIVDSWTRDPVWIGEYPKRRIRVHQAYKIG